MPFSSSCKEILEECKTSLDVPDSNQDRKEKNEDRPESSLTSNTKLETTKITMAELELLKKLEEANR